MGVLFMASMAKDSRLLHQPRKETALLVFFFLSSFTYVEDIAANHDIIHPVFAGPTGTPAEKAFNEGVHWGLEETGITVNVEAYLVSLAGFA
jgi:hypothetical protein